MYSRRVYDGFEMSRYIEAGFSGIVVGGYCPGERIKPSNPVSAPLAAADRGHP
jgi:hypothetical protein